jgi:hypothetical protein
VLCGPFSALTFNMTVILSGVRRSRTEWKEPATLNLRQKVSENFLVKVLGSAAWVDQPAAYKGIIAEAPCILQVQVITRAG